MAIASQDEVAAGGEERGRQADSPGQMSLKGWREIAVRTWNEASSDNIALVASGVAFYAFLALVPMLAALVLSYGLIARPDAVVSAMQSMTTILPANISQLIGDMLLNVVRSSDGKKGFGILIALAVAIWGARNAAGSIIIALNIAFEEEEKRGFLTRTLLSLTMTLGAVFLGLAAIAAMTALKYLATLYPSMSGTVQTVGRIIAYPLLLCGAAGSAATLYRYGPSRTKAKWSWLTPGSIFSALGWMALTLGFGLYVSRVGHFDATYGSLGAVVALLTWMYLSSYVFLFGAELNSEIEHQTVKDTTDGSVKPLGTRGAWSADNVAQGVESEDEANGKGGKSSTLADNDLPKDRESTEPSPQQSVEPSAAKTQEHAFLASRLTSHAARFAGLAKVGTVVSILSTAGLSQLRRRGKARTGAALLLTAAGLAFIRREDPPGV